MNFSGAIGGLLSYEVSTDRPDNVELIYGTHIYRYNFDEEYWVLVRKLPDVDWGEVANVAIADMDLDGDVDAIGLRVFANVGECFLDDAVHR